MKENRLVKLTKAYGRMNKVFLKQCDIVVILLAHGFSRADAIRIYNTMSANYVKFLEDNNYVNCGIKGVPNTLAFTILEAYGITKEAIKQDLESEIELCKSTSTTNA